MPPPIVVAGAGHNGLVAGCYLARAGLDVLVLAGTNPSGGILGTPGRAAARAVLRDEPEPLREHVLAREA